MFQFEYLNMQKMSGLSEFIDRFEAFLELIDTKYLYGVEIRNPNYLKKPFFEFLQRNKLVMVFLQGYYMPSIVSVFRSLNPPVRKQAVIRLHGPDRQQIEKLTGKQWNRIVAPKDEDLPGIARMVSDLLERSLRVYLNINNHYEGSAPLSIDKIQALLETLAEQNISTS